MKSKYTLAGVGLVVVQAAFFSAFFSAPVEAQEKPLVFRDVRVFDGAAVNPKTTVVARGGRIVRMGIDVQPPKGAEVIEGAGRTLLPGLLDCHTHTFFTEQLKQAVVFGVTTQFDMLSDHRFAARMRSAQKEGKAADRASLFSSGTAVTAPGGHGTQFGLMIPTINGPQEAQDFIDARIAEKSDFIKIIYEDGKAIGLKFNSISRATLEAVVKAAHARGKLAVAHVGSAEGASHAIEAGVDGLVHLFVDQMADDKLIQLAVMSDVFVIPTLTVLQGVTGVGSGTPLVKDDPLSPFLSSADVRSLKAAYNPPRNVKLSFAHAQKSALMLHKAGVPILVGTDAPNPGTVHGASIHRELELLVEVGLSPSAALAGATGLAAEKFRLQDRGRIAPGMRADLLLVVGDPTANIKHTRRIVGVWKGGHRIDRKKHLSAIEDERKRLAQGRGSPPPRGLEKGLISNFDGERIATSFGAGWSLSTDSFVGGKSTAKFKLATGGAGKTKGSLQIQGEIDDRPQPRWAGVMFSPGKTTMAPANLSSKKRITFWSKGDGKTYYIMLFFQKRGFSPSTKTFKAGKDWKRHQFSISSFDGCDGSDVMAVFFGGGHEKGGFTFQIDEVMLEGETKKTP